MSAFLVDTSFLISLADRDRKHHAVARSYFREALKRGVPLYLSAIVVSEFQVKQAVTDLPMRNFSVLPFNIDHAMTAGLLMRDIQRDEGDDRVAVKDDVKLIAQAVCESLTHILTCTDRNVPNPFPATETVAPGTAVDGCSSSVEGVAASTATVRLAHKINVPAPVTNAFINKPLSYKKTYDRHPRGTETVAPNSERKSEESSVKQGTRRL